MADFDYDGRAHGLEDAPPRVPRPFVPPVRIRLTGDTDLHVIAALDVLRLIFTITDLSRLQRCRDGRFQLYAEISRDFPLFGGIK